LDEETFREIRSSENSLSKTMPMADIIAPDKSRRL
jgi:hypothetical protein